jgi:hypothetical protein
MMMERKLCSHYAPTTKRPVSNVYKFKIALQTFLLLQADLLTILQLDLNVAEQSYTRYTLSALSQLLLLLPSSTTVRKA